MQVERPNESAEGDREVSSPVEGSGSSGRSGQSMDDFDEADNA